MTTFVTCSWSGNPKKNVGVHIIILRNATASVWKGWTHHRCSRVWSKHIHKSNLHVWRTIVRIMVTVLWKVRCETKLKNKISQVFSISKSKTSFKKKISPEVHKKITIQQKVCIC